MKVLLLTSLGVAFGLSGDYCFKSNQSLPIGFLLYAMSGIPVWLSYRSGSWMQVALYWAALSVAVSLCMGVFFFHETIGPKQAAAFACAFAAVLLWNS